MTTARNALNAPPWCDWFARSVTGAATIRPTASTFAAFCGILLARRQAEIEYRPDAKHAGTTKFAPPLEGLRTRAYILSFIGRGFSHGDRIP